VGRSITARTIEEILEHTHVQFSRTAEREWAHVTDRRRLVALDGLALDAGTSSGDAGTIDTEDYAVLFELDRRRARKRGRPAATPPAHDLIMIDEAQELAPIELGLVGRSLAPGGTLVVAGDPAQQIDPSVTFTNWEASMRALGCEHYDTVTLEVGYRCPVAVQALARRILGASDSSPPSPACATRSNACGRGTLEESGRRRPRGSQGSSVLLRAPEDEADFVAWLGRELSTLAPHDRTATTAIVARAPLFARRFAERLRAYLPTRLVLDGGFLARGGVQVTTVDQVRGLEFDHVVVPDATAPVYPNDAASRRALYVAVTRTRHQLVLAGAGERTRLLPAE
jgi:superfamily I DNA/RNA helicase